MAAEPEAPPQSASPEERRLIEALDSWRRDMGLRHGPFAASILGVERTIWYLMRTGKRGVSRATLRRVLAKNPALWASLNAAGLEPAEPPPVAEPPQEHDGQPDRALVAFAEYLLGQTRTDDGAAVSLAEVGRWWQVWRAAWGAAADAR